MAKLRSGILGNIRGKVAGVVGGQWKNINYVREYVKPANPNTVAQQTQRTKMSDAVAFCKSLVGPVFNAYTDVFQKAMSGFNRFIKTNIAFFDGDVDYSEIVVTAGKLHVPGTVSAVYYVAGELLEMIFDESLGNNGLLTDKIYCAVYHEPTGIWYFPPAEVNRDASTVEIVVPNGLTSEDFHCYLWAIAYNGSIVTSLSNSAYAVGADE